MQSIEAGFVLGRLDRDAIEAVIRDLWTLRLRDAPAAVRRYAAPDIAYRIVGKPGNLPGPHVYVGHDAVIEALAGLDRSFEFLSMEFLDFIVDGNQAAVRWHGLIRNRGAGTTAELGVFDHVVVSNGLIESYTEFLDTQAFSLLLQGEPQSQTSRIANERQKAIRRSADFQRPPFDLTARNANEALLRTWWTRRVAEGSTGLRDLCTDDFEIHLVGDSTAVPFARSHIGLAASIALIDQIDMEFAWESIDIQAVLIEHDRGAVRWRADVRHRGTSARGFVEAFDHVVIADGKLRAFTEFFDTAATARWIDG